MDDQGTPTDGLSQVEPEVSTLRASIPSADDETRAMHCREVANLTIFKPTSDKWTIVYLAAGLSYNRLTALQPRKVDDKSELARELTSLGCRTPTVEQLGQWLAPRIDRILTALQPEADSRPVVGAGEVKALVERLRREENWIRPGGTENPPRGAPLDWRGKHALIADCLALLETHLSPMTDLPTRSEDLCERLDERAATMSVSSRCHPATVNEIEEAASHIRTLEARIGELERVAERVATEAHALAEAAKLLGQTAFAAGVASDIEAPLRQALENDNG